MCTAARHANSVWLHKLIRPRNTESFATNLLRELDGGRAVRFGRVYLVRRSRRIERGGYVTAEPRRAARHSQLKKKTRLSQSTAILVLLVTKWSHSRFGTHAPTYQVCSNIYICECHAIANIFALSPLFKQRLQPQKIRTKISQHGMYSIHTAKLLRYQGSSLLKIFPRVSVRVDLKFYAHVRGGTQRSAWGNLTD